MKRGGDTDEPAIISHGDSGRCFARHGAGGLLPRPCRGVRAAGYHFGSAVDDAPLHGAVAGWTAFRRLEQRRRRHPGAFSADQGRHWSAPKCLLKTSTGRDYDPSLVVSGPRILLTTTVTAGSGIGRSTTQCVRSDDNGQSWSPLYEIPMHHRYSCGKTHHGLRLKSGTLLMGYSWDLLCEQGKTLQEEGQMHLRAA